MSSQLYEHQLQVKWPPWTILIFLNLGLLWLRYPQHKCSCREKKTFPSYENKIAVLLYAVGKFLPSQLLYNSNEYGIIPHGPRKIPLNAFLSPYLQQCPHFGISPHLPYLPSFTHQGRVFHNQVSRSGPGSCSLILLVSRIGG